MQKKRLDGDGNYRNRVTFRNGRRPILRIPEIEELPTKIMKRKTLIYNLYALICILTLIYCAGYAFYFFLFRTLRAILK